MTDLEILARIVLALGFGAILGLETETRTEGETEVEHDARMRRRLGGVRTYTVLSLFGALGGLLYNQGQVVFAYLVFLSVFLIVLAAYIFNVRFSKAFGMTTEIAILITTLVGFAATSAIISVQILIVIIVVLTFIMSQKQGVSSITRKVAHGELIDVVKYAIVALVIFPFLPNQNYYLSDVSALQPLLNNIAGGSVLSTQLILINPFKMWQYVVLISGFSLLGYFAHRALGSKRGLLLTGLFGGFVSSTTTMLVMAQKSKQSDKLLSQQAAAALVANSVSFLQIMVLAASSNAIFFHASIAVSLLLSLGSALTALFLLWSDPSLKHEVAASVTYTPFSLWPAVKFALMLTVLRIVVQMVSLYQGAGAFIVVTAFSGILGMDLATITLGEMVGRGEIVVTLALVAFVLTNVVNYAAKSFYAYLQGSRKFSQDIFLGLLFSLICGVGAMVLVLPTQI